MSKYVDINSKLNFLHTYNVIKNICNVIHIEYVSIIF